MPDWALLFRLFGPNEAYDRLLRAGFDINLAARYAANGAPVYVDWWMGIVVLVVWFAVPLVVGFHRFESADLYRSSVGCPTGVGHSPGAYSVRKDLVGGLADRSPFEPMS
jgi:hypothetical protein